MKKLSIFFILICLFIFTSQANASENRKFKSCSNDPKLTPTPTKLICEVWRDEKWIPCITPTPTIEITPSITATPSSTPIPTSTPSTGSSISDGGSSNPDTTKAHDKVCTIKPQPPTNPWFIHLTPNSVKTYWGKSTDTVELQALKYGYTKDNLQFGEIISRNAGDSAVQSEDIRALATNTPIWVKVCVYKNNCESCSDTIDP